MDGDADDARAEPATVAVPSGAAPLATTDPAVAVTDDRVRLPAHTAAVLSVPAAGPGA